MRGQGYNGDGEVLSSAYVAHEAVDFVDDTPSLTRQEFAEDCDINAIMARYEKTGVISHVRQREPMYLDLTELPDLHNALNIMREAEIAFMSLPAAVRAEFLNDAEAFLAFAQDPENIDQMREWGLAKPAEPPPEPLSVKVISDVSSSADASASSGTTPKA